MPLADQPLTLRWALSRSTNGPTLTPAAGPYDPLEAGLAAGRRLSMPMPSFAVLPPPTPSAEPLRGEREPLVACS